MLREVKPSCLYLRGTVRAEFGKEFAIYAKNSQVTSGVGGTQKKKTAPKTNKPDLPLGNSSTSQLFSGSGVSCYINILEALQKGWHSHYICGAWLIGFCVWRMGMERDKEVKSPRCKQGLLLPMAYTVAYVLKRVSAPPVPRSRCGNAAHPSLHPSSALRSRPGSPGRAAQPRRQLQWVQQWLTEQKRLTSAQKWLTSRHTKIHINSAVLSDLCIRSRPAVKLLPPTNGGRRELLTQGAANSRSSQLPSGGGCVFPLMMWGTKTPSLLLACLKWDGTSTHPPSRPPCRPSALFSTALCPTQSGSAAWDPSHHFVLCTLGKALSPVPGKENNLFPPLSPQGKLCA